uniref:meiosis inhibitor protein 1 isoform X2 n=1 Tax=Pristiophorus japonicus TaxID=55135 RepID=UPI00398F0E6E
MEDSSSDNWNVVCERIHSRHDGHWTLRFREDLQDREQLLCVACVIEMVEDNGISIVRKKYALACFRNVLVRFPGAVVELLSMDARVCVHFIITLLDMLRNVDDSITMELAIEVLALLTAELKSEQFVCCVLDECQKQLSEKNSLRRSLPIFTLLGKLLLAIPFLAEKLIQEYTMLLEQMRVALVYPDEAVKASVCYIFCTLYSYPPAAEKLSTHFNERLCKLFVSIMEAAQTKELQVNSIGLLKHLLQFRQFVTVMMSSFETEEVFSEEEVISQGGNSLLLLLKKLLLSGDETLQIASVQCMTSILVHSPVQYAPALVYADIPEFLFERLSSTDEILVWSVYSCLLLLTEEKLFFSKCHTIYGIESLVRSLKETMRMNNIEVQKQGLLLFGEILKRQPTGIKLFMNFTIWHEAIVVLQEAMTSSSLEVMTEAVNAVAAFLRKDHLAVPVQYQELQQLIEAMLMRCADLPMPSMMRSNTDTIRSKESQSVRREQTKKFSRQGQLLFSALEAFLNACRLALDCQKDPSVQENAFKSPSIASENMLERYSEFLLKVCDTLCIPIVMKHYEKTPSATVMEVFFSILSVQYRILPNTANLLSIKLASSSFIRFTMELKGKFCIGGRNPKLNQACSDFLCGMCRILFSATENVLNYQHDLDDISELFAKCIPHLNYSVSDALTMLSESSDTIGIDESLQNSSYCILVILYLAHMYENRFFSEGRLFTAISSFLHTSLDRGHSPPPFVLRSVLYLLSVCQEKCSNLDWVSLSSICKLLEGVSDFSSVYTCHPLVLKFFFHYPELTDKFGHSVLKCWFAHVDISCFEDEKVLPNSQGDTSCTMNIQGNPNVLLILLDMVHTGEMELAFKALLVLKLFLRNSDNILPTSDLLRPRLLQILQRFTIENNTQLSKGNKNLPLVLDLLSLVQIKIGDVEEMGSTDFKLLYHVSNLAGKCKALSTEILQPAFNFFYCSLKQTSNSNRNRVVSMLLSNSSLMELLEKILELSWSEQSTLESLPDVLVCSVWLLLSTLVQNQTNCKSEVHRTVGVDLNKVLHCISLRKNTSLAQVCILQFLKTVLRHNFISPLLAVTVPNTRNRPLQDQDAALYPLSYQQVLLLCFHLQNFLVQGDDVLVYAAIGCLEALMEYLHIRDQAAACHVVSQPWSRFLLFTLVNSAQNCPLNSGFFRLFALFLKYRSKNILFESDVRRVLQVAAELKLEELSSDTAEALILFLKQLDLQSGKVFTMGKKDMEVIHSLLESLQNRTSSQPDTKKIVGGNFNLLLLIFCTAALESVIHGPEEHSEMADNPPGGTGDKEGVTVPSIGKKAIPAGFQGHVARGGPGSVGHHLEDSPRAGKNSTISVGW